MQSIKKQTTTKSNGIVAALSKLRVIPPKDYDWKQDYMKALEEKYANIHRR